MLRSARPALLRSLLMRTYNCCSYAPLCVRMHPEGTGVEVRVGVRVGVRVRVAVAVGVAVSVAVGVELGGGGFLWTSGRNIFQPAAPRSRNRPIPAGASAAVARQAEMIRTSVKPLLRRIIIFNGNQPNHTPGIGKKNGEPMVLRGHDISCPCSKCGSSVIFG